MSDATGGVPRLVSGPRKKPTKTLSANSNVASPSRCLKNSNGLAPRFLPTRRGRGRQFGIARA